jgi:molybdenum-dependent DNA-binding transcriptional regulator ModE
MLLALLVLAGLAVVSSRRSRGGGGGSRKRNKRHGSELVSQEDEDEDEDEDSVDQEDSKEDHEVSPPSGITKTTKPKASNESKASPRHASQRR